MRLKFIFTMVFLTSLSFAYVSAQQTAKITSSGIGYLEYVPQNYNSNNNDYPIVIFLHGIGERGTTSTDPTTLKTSVQKVANVGLAKYVKAGTQYPFILISPQLKSSYGTWPANYVMDVLNYVKTYLRVDERRIYITGLSLGGFGTWTTLGAYPKVFAAAVPICSGGSALSKACVIAAENIPLWAFHGTSDAVVSYTVTTKMINAINACTPKPSPLAKTTLFSGLGHNVWDKVYKETSAVNWMLGFTKGSAASSPSNILPVVSAGADKSITLPANEVSIQGTASDADGSIVSYSWSKISGGAAGLTGTTGSKLRAYNLVAGSYTFRFTVKDNSGASKYDDVKVTVLGSSATSTTNIAPIANAGADKSITLPLNTITLNGSGTDKDGEVISYKWTQYGGAAVTLTGATSASVKISGMREGKYYFRLTVTDDRGATDFDNMLIVVKGTSTAYNIKPVSSAGADKRITTAANSIRVNGLGTDKDGRIVSYKWMKYGGAAVTLTNSTSSTVTVSGLKEGKYYLKLTVKDNDGAVDDDNMLIVVNES